MKQINNVKDLTEALNFSEGFMINVTLLNKGQLTHYLLTEKFPQLDMLRSLKSSKELVINKLENVTAEIQKRVETKEPKLEPIVEEVSDAELVQDDELNTPSEEVK